MRDSALPSGEINGSVVNVSENGNGVLERESEEKGVKLNEEVSSCRI